MEERTLLVIKRPQRVLIVDKLLCLFVECPRNCDTCQVTDNSATVATCTACNDYYKLIAATINSVSVAGNCYRSYILLLVFLCVLLPLFPVFFPCIRSDRHICCLYKDQKKSRFKAAEKKVCDFVNDNVRIF